MSRKTAFQQTSAGTRLPLSASDNDRFDSFINWRGKKDKEALVNAGFFYLGEEDAVRCFFCQLEIRDWTEDMDPLGEHVRRAPGCEYLPQLLSNRDLAKVKEQLFDITKMRPPTEGAFNWHTDISTGERVDSSRPLAISSERSLGRDNVVHQEASGGGAIRADENKPVRGEISQDVGTQGVIGDDDMDFLLHGTAAQSVLQTGCATEDNVRAAIIDLRRTGKQDFNGEDIMMLILGD